MQIAFCDRFGMQRYACGMVRVYHKRRASIVSSHSMAAPIATARSSACRLAQEGSAQMTMK
jgi:hypothetical protein